MISSLKYALILLFTIAVRDIYDDLVLPSGSANIAYGLQLPNDFTQDDVTEECVAMKEGGEATPNIPGDHGLSEKVPLDYELAQENPDHAVDSKVPSFTPPIKGR